MEWNISQLERLVDMEAIAGFEEFLSAFNLTFETTNTTAEPISSEPETIVSAVLVTVAIILNVFAICGTSHIPNGLTTHSKLIISLALSDILIVVSVFGHQLIRILHEQVNPFTSSPDERETLACSYAFIISLNITAHLISLLNLFMMAVDHYLAIIKPFRYAFLLNKRNSRIILAVMWCVAILGGFVNFLTGIGNFNANKSHINYCEYIMYNDFHGDYLVIGLTFLSLFSIVYIYMRIYYEVRLMNKRLISSTFNKEHNVKTLVTTLLIIGTFVIFWIPLFTFQTVLLIQIQLDPGILIKKLKSLLVINKYLYMLLLVNSICDPVIYAVRLKEVQLGYKRFCKSTCGNFSIFQKLNLQKSSPIPSTKKRKETQSSDTERTDIVLMDEHGYVIEKDKYSSKNGFDTQNDRIIFEKGYDENRYKIENHTHKLNSQNGYVTETTKFNSEIESFL